MGRSPPSSLPPPPLLVFTRAHPRAVSVRRINPHAVTYARSIHQSLESVYPGALSTVRAMAPPLTRESRAGVSLEADAAAFVRSTGMTFGDVYPNPPSWSTEIAGSKAVAETYAKLVGRPFGGESGIYGEVAKVSGGSSGWRWALGIAGMVLGAAAGGPIGLVIGGTVGGLLDALRSSSSAASVVVRGAPWP
jgi:hypothetical protein